MSFEQRIQEVVHKATKNKLSELASGFHNLFGKKKELGILKLVEIHYANVIDDLIEENSKLELTYLKRIEALEQQVIEFQDLFNNADVSLTKEDSSENDSLVDRHKKLQALVKHYQNELEQRVAVTNMLRSQKVELQNELDEESSLIVFLPEVPTDFQLNEMQEYINSLQSMKETRLHQIKNYQKEGKGLMTILGEIECENSELLNNDYVQPTQSNVKSLKRVVSSLKTTCEWKQQEFDTIKNELLSYWKMLDMPEEHHKLFEKEVLTLTDDYYKELCEELDLCKRIKTAKIPEIIEGLREKLLDYTEKCKKSKTFLQHSVLFAAFEYTEAIVEKFESELEQLMSFYEDNKEIFKAYDEREQVKEKLESMTMNHNSTERFKNRGGQLLREEQERKRLEIKLMKVEMALSKLIQEFQLKYKNPFTIYGKPVMVEQDNIESRFTLKKQLSSTELRLKKQVNTLQMKSKESSTDLRPKKPFAERKNI